MDLQPIVNQVNVWRRSRDLSASHRAVVDHSALTINPSPTFVALATTTGLAPHDLENAWVACSIPVIVVQDEGDYASNDPVTLAVSYRSPDSFDTVDTYYTARSAIIDLDDE